MLDPIQRAFDEFHSGNMIILVDDEDRENEGDLVMPAQFITPESINFMAKYGRGLICMTLDADMAENIGLTPMVPRNESGHGTAFTVSIEAATGVTTGISAADRAHTIQVAVNPKATPEDLVSPGHVFPIVAKPGGVLVRAGHTEASVDLARLCNLAPAAVICEIMKEDGEMARLPDLREFADEHDLALCSIADLINHRIDEDNLVSVLSESTIETRFGRDFKVIVYGNSINDLHHVALVCGDIKAEKPLIRMHGENTMDDLFATLLSPTPSRLTAALEKIAASNAGALVYMRNNESSLLGESNDKMDLRSYGIGAQILRSLGVEKFELLTDNPKKIVGIEGFGLQCTGTQPMSSDNG